MEEAINNQWQLPIAELHTYKRTRRRGSGSTDSEAKQTEEREFRAKRKKGEVDGTIVVVEEDANKNANYVETSDGVKVSVFDFSVVNFFHYLDTISKLCGEPMVVDIEEGELQQLSSSVTFLREWKSYQYEPSDINFACEVGSSELKDVARGVILPQFSSAAVPKKEEPYGGVEASKSSKDFVMYVGGLVWALDWCPRMPKQSDGLAKREFIAISAHPPRGSYHKLGVPLSGRGVIQIWCVLNNSQNNEEVSHTTEKCEKNTKRARGRPRKPIDGKIIEATNNPYVPALTTGGPKKLLKELTDNTNTKRPRGRPRKKPMEGQIVEASNKHFVQALPTGEPKKHLEELINDTFHDFQAQPVGRVKQKTVEEQINENTNDQFVQAWARRHERLVEVDQSLSVQYPKSSAEIIAVNEAPKRSKGCGMPQDSRQKQKCYRKASSAPRPVAHISVNEKSELSAREESLSNDTSPLFFMDNGHETSHQTLGRGSNSSVRGTVGDEMSCTLMTEFENYVKHHTQGYGSTSIGQGTYGKSTNLPLLVEHGNDRNHQTEHSKKDPVSATCSATEDVPLPQLILCLAHNGEVAWDVKWRPLNGNEYMSKHLMGYLAVLLGNGFVEVWEVPLPWALQAIYSFSEGTDPRFIKLDPVFRCSMLKCGGIQSIPLTVEWSVSSPHDYLLAGCHDGTVALWKFRSNSSCRDARPLLCFSADTVPIRSVAWAPIESNTDSANIILTASHGGLKFWDIRDPFQPLWDIHPSQRMIYGLDWISDPSCIIMSFDDGTMRTLSLLNGATDVPVNGRNQRENKLGLHTYNCSSFAVWSVQVSRVTGLVAYCCADGNVVRFQLTAKAVGSDYARNRPPQFLCGSFRMEESTLVVNTPVQNTPLHLKPSNKQRDGQQSLGAASKQGKKTDYSTKKTSDLDEPASTLCNGDDTSIESEPPQTSAKSKQMSKANSCIKRKPVMEQTKVCKEDDSTTTDRNVKENLDTAHKFEAFPPKIVAVNVVRWNTNRGSEKWLCYGGASGLVRCQEIILSEVDKALATKR